MLYELCGAALGLGRLNWDLVAIKGFTDLSLLETCLNSAYTF
jgi:hypothetical protein